MKKLFILLPVVLIFLGAGCVSTDRAKQTQLDNKAKCYEAATKKFEEIKNENTSDPLALFGKTTYLNEGYAYSEKYNSCFLKYGSFNEGDPLHLIEWITNVYTGENVAMHIPGDDLKSEYAIEKNKKYDALSLEIFGK